MLGSSRAKPLADLVRFEAIKKDEAAVARPDGGHPVGSKRLPGSGTIPLQIRRDRIYEPYGVQEWVQSSVARVTRENKRPRCAGPSQ